MTDYNKVFTDLFQASLRGTAYAQKADALAASAADDDADAAQLAESLREEAQHELDYAVELADELETVIDAGEWEATAEQLELVNSLVFG